MVLQSMIDRLAFAVALSLFAVAAHAAPLGKTITVGYLQLTDDPRYDDLPGPGDTTITPPRPVAGAEMGVSEANLAIEATGHSFALEKVEADNVAGLEQKVDALAKNGVHWFVVDAPDAAMAALAKAMSGRDVLLLNISAPGDELRGAACQKDLADLIPSRGMLTDALAQLLVARKWRDVLVLRGPLPQDKAMTAAFEHSAKRFGLSIAATRDFVLSNDPRLRNEDNAALLTGDASYDTVFIADAEGEFSRALPYNTIRPRPVIGATGLVPTAWSWTWDRYGAPQVSDRFQRAYGRQMDGADWAAWLAIRALGEAVQRSGASDTAGVDAYLLGPKLSLDGAKGPPLSFRAWDHQLRQPILLTTADAVVAEAPLPGFLHQTNVLDTLGSDQPETQCHF
jgi:ABC transporter substrate binding protein (PQQ-dependent alcohol dehydrogenase system)